MKESSQQRERERERERRNISLLSQKHSSYYVKDYGGKNYGNGCQRCQKIELITRELILNY